MVVGLVGAFGWPLPNEHALPKKSPNQNLGQNFVEASGLHGI